jgi:hypothetical protein
MYAAPADRGRRRQVDEPRHPRPRDPPTHR